MEREFDPGYQRRPYRQLVADYPDESVYPIDAIPARDLPPGLPPWMGALDAWAIRSGETKQMKRASITVTVPTVARTWPPVPG